MHGGPQPAFGYIFGGEESENPAGTHEDGASRHRSSHSPVLSHKTLGVATPVLWDDGDKASHTSSSYNRWEVWDGGLPQVLDAAVSSGTQGGSKPGPEWPKGEEAELRLAEYRNHSEHIFSIYICLAVLFWDVPGYKVSVTQCVINTQ